MATLRRLQDTDMTSLCADVEALVIPTHLDLGPMRWSDDFGRFGHAANR